MTTYSGKSYSFCLPRVPFVNCRQFMYLVISLLGFEGRIWDLIVSVPDHCLSFYFNSRIRCSGQSAKELWTRLSQFAHEQLPISDRESKKISNDQELI